MSTFELVRIALTSLLQNRLRSLLTILGIVIGVGAVVALVSFGQSYQNYVDSQFQGIGASTLFIMSANPNGPHSQLVTVKPLTMGDAQALADPPNVTGVAPMAPLYQLPVHVVPHESRTPLDATGIT